MTLGSFLELDRHSEPVPKIGNADNYLSAQEYAAEDISRKDTEGENLTSIFEKFIQKTNADQSKRKKPSDTSAKEQREIDDLAAQEAMAKYTKLMNFATWVAACGTVAGVVLLAFTFNHTKTAAVAAKSAADSGVEMVNEAKKTTEVTREIGNAQAQPYLSIEDVKTSDFRITDKLFDPDDGIRSLTFSFSISNKGNSPAIDVAINARVALAFQGQGTSGQKMSTTAALNPVVLNYVTKGKEEGKTLLFNGCFNDGPPTKINPKNTIITIDFDVSYKDVFSDKITRVTETHMALNISAKTELWRISSKFEQFSRTDT